MKLDLAEVRKRLDPAELKKLADPAELKRRFQVRSLLTLTLEAERIVASVVRSDATDVAPRAPITIAVGADEVVRQPEKAAQTVALALAEAGLRERRCVVCVPPSWALSTATDLPALELDDLRGFLEIRAEQEFSLPAGDLRLGYCVYALPDGQPRATLAVVSAKRLKAVETLVETLGRRLVSVSLALEDALADPRPTLHFQANGSHTDVIITGGGGAIAALRSLASPLGTEEAPFDAGAFCREVRITLGRLPMAIRQQVVQAQFGGTLASAQRLCAEIHTDLQRMGIQSPACDAPLPGRSESEALGAGAAADAAGRQLRGEPVPFEFVVPEVRRWQAVLTRLDTKRHRGIAAGVVGLILLPLVIFFIRSEIEDHLNTEWNGMRDNVSAARRVDPKDPPLPPLVRSRAGDVASGRKPHRRFPRSGRRLGQEHPVHPRLSRHLHRFRPQPIGPGLDGGPLAGAARHHRSAGPATTRRRQAKRAVFHHLRLATTP